MRRLAAPLPLVLLAALALSACAPEPAATPAPTTSAAATATRTPSPTPTPTPTPTPDPVVTITLDGLQEDEDAETIEFADGADVVAFLIGLTGESPVGEQVPGCPEGYICDPLTRYDFPGMRIWVDSGGGSRVSVDAAEVAGIRVETAEGVSVGTSRADALAAGAEETTYPAQFPHLAIGAREVPGTDSLVTPGETGSEYLLLVMTGDTVSQIQLGNDFSDL